MAATGDLEADLLHCRGRRCRIRHSLGRRATCGRRLYVTHPGVGRHGARRILRCIWQLQGVGLPGCRIVLIGLIAIVILI